MEAHRLQEVHRMSTESASASFVSRVLKNQDALRKGLAAAVAGAIISVVSEALWPSNR
jgi:predicted transcriptional regulator